MLCYLGYVHGCEWTNEFHLLNVKSKCVLLYTKSTGYLIKSALCFSRQHGYIHGYEWTNEFHLLNVKSKCVLLYTKSTGYLIKSASDITTRTTTLVVNGPIKLHLINVNTYCYTKFIVEICAVFLFRLCPWLRMDQ